MMNTPFAFVSFFEIIPILMITWFGISAFSNGHSGKFFSFFCFTSVGWLISLYLGFLFEEVDTIHLSTQAFRASFGFGIVALGLLPLFFYAFPRRVFVLSKLTLLLFLGIISLLAIVSTFTGLIYEKSIIPEAQNSDIYLMGPFYLYYVTVFLVCFFLSLVLAIQKLKIAKGIDKKKIQFCFGGLLIAVFCIMLTNVILPAFGIVFFQEQSALFSLIFIAPTFYAIIRYRFLDISLTLQKICSWLTHLLLYVLPLVFAYQLLPTDRVIFVAIILAVTALFWGKDFVSFFDRFWNYVFFQKPTNKVQDIHQSLASFEESLAQGISELSHTLGVTDGSFVFADVAHQQYRSMTSYFQQNPAKALVLDECVYTERPDLERIEHEMEDMMVSLALPVFDAERKLLGLLLLEKKIDGSLFSSQEIQATKTVLQGAVVSILKASEHKKMVSQPDGFMKAFLHEIRTPLQVARTSRELANWKQDHPEDINFIQESEEALGQATRKLDVIAEAFEWQQGIRELTISKIQLANFLKQLARGKKNIEFHVQPGKLSAREIEVDVHHLQQALNELLDNALFFSGNAPVLVEVLEEKGRVVFDVIDAGKGIPKHHWEDVFELLFVLSESRNAKECGIGAGLTKARGILKAHGGKCLIAESSPKGTTVRVIL